MHWMHCNVKKHVWINKLVWECLISPSKVRTLKKNLLYDYLGNDISKIENFKFFNFFFNFNFQFSFFFKKTEKKTPYYSWLIGSCISFWLLWFHTGNLLDLYWRSLMTIVTRSHKNGRGPSLSRNWNHCLWHLWHAVTKVIAKRPR